MIDEQITPELVLVDPELAARVRPFAVAGPEIRVPTRTALVVPELPSLRQPAFAPPPDVLPVAPPDVLPVAPADVLPVAPPQDLPPVPEPERPRSRRRRLVFSRALPTAAVLAVLSLAFLSPRDAPSLSDAPIAGAPTTPPTTTPTIPGTTRRTTPRTTPRTIPTPPARPKPTPPERPVLPRHFGPSALTWLPRPAADYYLVELYRGRRLVHAASVRGPTFAVPRWLQPGRYDWRVYAGKGLPRERRTGPLVDNGWFLIT